MKCVFGREGYIVSGNLRPDSTIQAGQYISLKQTDLPYMNKHFELGNGMALWQMLASEWIVEEKTPT